MPRPLYQAIICTLFLMPAMYVGAYAPQRSGQPYAESICNDAGNGGQAEILLCEDFDFPGNFSCSGGSCTWSNPGIVNDGVPYGSCECSGADFPAAAGFPSPPAGSPTGGNVYRARPGVDPGGSTYNACLIGDCNRTTNDNVATATYANGLSSTNDLYIRFQMYTHTDWYWPTQTDNKVLFLYPNTFTGRTDANIDAGFYFFIGTHCNSPLQNFNDAMVFRVGSNSGNYKSYPGANNAGAYNSHFEYCDGEGTPDGQFSDATVAVDRGNPPTAEPNPGTMYRVIEGRWYTIEFRYRLSTAGVTNGIIELWVDGVKVYSDSDLETCGGYGAAEGSCAAIAELNFLGSWYNFFNSDYNNAQSNGQSTGTYRLIDNLIVSRAPIGVPSAGEADTLAPGSPMNLRLVRP